MINTDHVVAPLLVLRADEVVAEKADLLRPHVRGELLLSTVQGNEMELVSSLDADHTLESVADLLQHCHLSGDLLQEVVDVVLSLV